MRISLKSIKSKNVESLNGTHWMRIGCKTTFKRDTLDAWLRIAGCVCNRGCNIADAVLNHVCCTVTASSDNFSYVCLNLLIEN